MASRIREETATDRQVDAVQQGMRAAARRPILVGALLTVALLTLFAMESLPSLAATVPVARDATTPAVSPVTVSVPGAGTPSPAATVPVAKPPTVSAPPANVLTATTPSASPVPPATSVTPTAQTPAASSVTTPAVASTIGRSPARHRSAHAVRSTVVPQRRLRSVVVRLSRCVSTLNPASQRMLLLRAGIGVVAPSSRRAVAQTLHMSVARETQREHVALLGLQAAARKQRCGSTPAWVHVPAGNRLVLVPPALATAATSSTTDAWWRLVWMAAQQS